ncbi:unnamed protein product, partial [Mesorhabditis spiculigera]
MPFVEELGVPRAPLPTPESTLRVIEMIRRTCEEMINQWKAGEREIDSIEFMLDGIVEAAEFDIFAWAPVMTGLRLAVSELGKGQLDALSQTMNVRFRRRADSDDGLCVVATLRFSIILAGCSYAFRSTRTPAQEMAYINAGLSLTDTMKEVERERGWSTRNTHEMGDGRLSLVEYNLTPQAQEQVNAKRLILNNALSAFINAYGDIPRRELALDMHVRTGYIVIDRFKALPMELQQMIGVE